MKKGSKIFISLILISMLAASACKIKSKSLEEKSAVQAIRTIGEIIRLDSDLDAIVAQDAEIEVLADGFDWTEGPVWIEEDGGYLLFSDIPPNSIFKWKEGEGSSLYLKPSGYTGSVERKGEPGSNGLFLDREGKLLLCQHGDRRIARMDTPLDAPEPNFITLCDNYNGLLLNSPNDAVMHSNGDIYFTDPPYGLEGNMDDENKQIPFQGVYRVDKSGKAYLLTDQISRPNGIAFSPDEKTLYVANSDGKNPIIMAFDVLADGSINDGSVFFDASELKKPGVKGSPDGLKVRSDGVLFATGPGGVLILNSEGKHLGTISSGEANSNCALDEKGGYLYATSDMYLIRVKLQ